MKFTESETWEPFVSRHLHAHLLQTSLWGRLKSEFGWEQAHVVRGDSGAQVLFRPLPLGFSLAYIPKGPVGDLATLTPDLDRLCRARRSIALKIEPDAWQPEGEAALPPEGFRMSRHSVQPPRTLVIDLTKDEDQLLGAMKQKTRYNIRLGQRKGVVVRQTGDLETFNRLMVATGERDAFGVHSGDYYRRAYELFHPHDMCELLIAEAEGIPLAALMLFMRGERAWYFYGASSNEYRNYMPTYVLQWEAMRLARKRGCTEYDLWGVPDFDEETLENEFTSRSDGLWGVYRFKRGFGGTLVRAQGPWDRVYRPLLYRIYERWALR